MDYETMDHLTEDRGGDLSSFAMLLLEPDNRHRHGDSRDGSALMREKSPRVVGRRPTQLPPTYLQQQSDNQYLQSRHFSMTIDERVPSQLSPTCIPSPSSPLPNVSGIRGFFRKRHKSVGNSSPLPNQGPQPDPEGVPGHASTPPKTPPSNNSGQSSGGSKIRSLFFGSSKNKQKVDPMSYFSVSLHEPVTRHSSLKQRHESIAIDSPVTRRNANSCYGDVIHEGDDDDYEYGSSSHRLLYGNIYHTPQQQSYLNSPAGGGSRHFSLLQKRSCSVRDVVGPVEFVEMFRSRANSEAQKSFPSDSLSNKSKTPRQVSGNLSNSSNSTPDYCPFEPRQVIIWKDSANGTQVFRLPSNEDEEKLMRQSPDEADDCPDMAYLRFLKSHPCYDVIPTSTKLIVLDTFLTVKKAFHALNDNRIHAAPLWDTKKQDFIGMLTITDFIRVLMQCHRDKMSILQNSEDHTLAYWAESLFGLHRQEMLYVTPDESMYEVINKLLSFKIHRLPIMDVDTGNILYIITLKRILRYLYLFFQHYNIPHPYFMNQTLVELNVGTYQDLALVTPKTKLSDALEMMINRRVSSLPIVNNTNKLVGIFNKNLMMGLDSEEAYADLGISIGQVFNGTTLVSAKTCLKTDFYQDVVGKIVNSEVHRVIVVDGNGRIEGVISCSDVMRHMVTQWEELTSIIQVGSSTSMNSDC